MDFNIAEDDGNPDEVSVPQQNEKPAVQTNSSNGSRPPNMQPPARPLSRAHSAGHPQRAPQTPAQNYPPRPNPPNQANQAAARPSHPLQQQVNQSRSSNPVQNGNQTRNSNSSNSSHQTPPQAQSHNGQAQGQNAAPPSEGVGFLSARAVKQLVGSDDQSVEKAKLPAAPLSTQAFNPHAESPSIRKTPGIDHTKSKPLSRTGQHVAPVESKAADAGGKNLGPAPIPLGIGAGRSGPVPNVGGGGFASAGGAGVQQNSGPTPAQRGGIGNPQLNQTRRIGAPAVSPMGNRGQYRPPTMKRSLQNEANIPAGAGAGARPVLAEVGVNGAVNAAPGGGAVGGDPKRQKMG